MGSSDTFVNGRSQLEIKWEDLLENYQPEDSYAQGQCNRNFLVGRLHRITDAPYGR